MTSESRSDDRPELPLDVLQRIDRACDRFEAVWREGQRPRIEDDLGEFAEAHRAALLRELLAAELDARRRLGERPEPGDYRDRFPGADEVIEAAFAMHQDAGVGEPAGTSVAADARVTLLCGLLGYQTGLIGQRALVDALAAWVKDQTRSVTDLLAGLGALDSPRRALLEGLLGEHLRLHDGDVEKSLAALPAGASTRERLASLGDTELTTSLARVCSGPGSTQPTDGYLDGTDLLSIGSASCDGLRFRVLRPHARGGLGAVFVALDTELHREVALKQMLDHHADDAVSRHRFLVEAEITGGLEHPGIVPVYGLGTYADGRPYYAMRFIRGDSLKEAINRFHGDDALRKDQGRRSLELRRLLGRFVDVCNAIEYAHSRGVLHRDIKPGNIIVGKHGETLVVDWGLAKATGRSEAVAGERTLVPSSASGSAETLPGSALGTPAYMSPEQARGELEHLGPRSDVYSLGATLYCLLTGKPPHEGEDIGEILHQVQRGEFAPPRQVDPAIDRALEAVCQKAMTARPDDRYATCRALVEDVERWMADEPVTAWPEPLARRARRWGHRHRTAISAAAVALVAGLIGLGAVAIVQARSNAALIEANEATKQALDETRSEKAKTEEALAQSDAVRTFLVEAFRSPDPSQDGREIKVADVLDRASQRLSQEFRGSEATRAALLDALGQTYAGLALHDKAVTSFAKSGDVREATLGPDHPDTLTSRYALARAYRRAGRLSEAIALHEKTLKLRQAKFGPDHPDTLQSRTGLAGAYYDARRLSDAISLAEATLKLKEAKFGPDHPDTIKSRIGLGLLYEETGRLPEAITLFEGTLKPSEVKLGADHPSTLLIRHNLVEAYRQAGRLFESISLAEANLKLMETRLSPDHPDTLFGRGNLAKSYQAAGRLSEAIALFESALKYQEVNPGPDHPDTLVTRKELASAYESLSWWGEAERLHRDVLARRRKTERSDSLLLAGDLADLGRNLLQQAKWSEVEPLLRECLALIKEPMSDDWRRYDVMSRLGGSLLGQGRHAEAEPLILQGYAGVKAREARIAVPSRSAVREAAERIVRLYEQWNRPDQATSWKARLGMPDLPADVFARP
jgi:serine/threonine protein kinase/tetratricopeptide (TPR) repeat protein